MAMLGFADGRGIWAIAPTRFARDVLASVLATGLATLAFSRLTVEPPPLRAPSVKAADRLAWTEEDVPTRTTPTFDSVAMFGLTFPEPQAWSDAPAHPPTPSVRTAAAREQVRTVAVLPPTRPALQLAAIAPGAPPTADARPRPIRLMGWALPGSEHLPVVPAPAQAWTKVAALGDDAAAFGQAVMATVGLR